ncbi:hypothetical protein GGF43_003109 [Coemansia sp. RSA 2618]|nr:hypothetical protein GGF43_003109 [Coemansia sp. RSA 2618]
MTHLRDTLSRLYARLPSTLTTRTGLSLAVRALLAAAAVGMVVLSSTVLYGVFYRLYVPQLLHQAPVYLQYPASALIPANTTADVSFVPASNYKFLSTSQAYTVSLDLDVPTSEANRMLGNFMVALELRDRRGRAVHQSARASILPYESRPVQLLRTLVRSVPLALGLADERARLHVPLIDAMYDKHFSPITSAWISLSKPLQVYSAHITIRAQFSGLRYWMYYWRLPTALAFIAVAVVWQLVLTAVAWSVIEAYASRSRSLPDHSTDNPTEALDSQSGSVNVSLNSPAALSRKGSSAQLQPPSAPGSPLVRALSFFDQQSAASDPEDGSQADAGEQSVPDSMPLRRRHFSSENS